MCQELNDFFFFFFGWNSIQFDETKVKLASISSFMKKIYIRKDAVTNNKNDKKDARDIFNNGLDTFKITVTSK